MRMWVIAHNLKVLKLVIVNAVRLALELQLRQRARITSQLQVNLLNMIQVNMRITHCNYNLANSQIALLRQHMS